MCVDHLNSVAGPRASAGSALRHPLIPITIKNTVGLGGFVRLVELFRLSNVYLRSLNSVVCHYCSDQCT